MPKFDMKEHDRQMREILNPPKTIIPLGDRLRESIRKRRLPKLPRM